MYNGRTKMDKECSNIVFNNITCNSIFKSSQIKNKLTERRHVRLRIRPVKYEYQYSQCITVPHRYMMFQWVWLLIFNWLQKWWKCMSLKHNVSAMCDIIMYTLFEATNKSKYNNSHQHNASIKIRQHNCVALHVHVDVHHSKLWRTSTCRHDRIGICILSKKISPIISRHNKSAL